MSNSAKEIFHSVQKVKDHGSLINTFVLTGIEDFDAIAAEWDDLHMASGSSVFQSHAWLRVWWRHFGEGLPGRRLHVVGVRRNSSLAGLCPFFIEMRKISVLASVRELRFIGEGLSDYSDFLVDPGEVQIVIEAVAKHIVALWKNIDAINFPEIPDDSPVGRLLFEKLKMSGVDVSMIQCDTCPRIDLRETWPETLAAITGDQRRQILKKCRQLADTCAVDFETIDDPSVLDKALVDFISLHQIRMEKTGKSGIFSISRNEAFLREIAVDFLDRGWLLLSFLKIDKRRVAASFSYLFRERVCFHLAGLGDAGDACRYSPGIVLHAMCMKESINKGFKIYDFLRGNEEYKYRFGAVDHANWRISARRIRPHIRLFGCAGAVLGWMRRTLVLCGLHARKSYGKPKSSNKSGSVD